MTMHRREFLQAVGASTPAALPASADAPATASANQPPTEPRVLLYDDGRHASPLYQYAPPLTPDDFVITVDQLADSGVDTLVYAAGLEGGTQIYDSRVAQTWGDNVKQWTHPVWYRAGRHLKQLIDDGHDPLELICQRAHQQKLLLLAGNWISLQGADRATAGGRGRQSDFVFDHAQFEVGPEKDPRARYAHPRRFSFLHQAVRDERLAVFEEMLTRYPTDGVEINLTEFVPLCRFDEVDQLSPLLTEWLRRLRKTADRAAQDQGRAKRIYVRLPTDISTQQQLGCDSATWIADGLVDGLVCMNGIGDAVMTQCWSMEPLKKLVGNSDCRLVAGFNNLLQSQFHRSATQAMTWAAAANAWDDGADGFAVVDYHWTPNGWPLTAEDYQTLRVLGHPELLRFRDKDYRALRLGRGQDKPIDWPDTMDDALPKPLEEKQPVELTLQIADDLEAAGRQQKIESVRLRIRITNIEASLNKVRVELNGKRLPESILSLDDLIYRQQPLGSFNPYGFVYEYRLPESLWPRRGKNRVRIKLVEKDRGIDTKFDVSDIDLVIDYNPQRHLRENPVSY